jgi:ribosomal protein S18 acetylase RimI-like enzyme
MREVDLRLAERGDVPSLLALLNADINITGSHDALFSETDIADYLADESYAVFVAEHRELKKIVGILAGRLYREYVHVEFFIVDEAHRNQGIGTALFDHLEHHAEENGIFFIEAMTEVNNEAIQKFLAKRGYGRGKEFIYWFKKTD